MTTSCPPDPDPEVPATVQRRRFSAAYRLRILKEADACKKPGEVGALLRREGLYSSLLANWRRQREAGALREMRGRRRGPTPRPVDPRVKQLEAEEPPTPAEAAAGGDDHHAPKKSCRDPGDPPDTPRRRRDRLMRAIEAVTTPGRDGGAVSERRRVPGVALSPAAPRAARPRHVAPCAVAARAGCHRAPGGARRIAQRAVRRPVARRSPCHVARGGDVSLCPAHDVSRACGGPRSERATR